MPLHNLRPFAEVAFDKILRGHYEAFVSSEKFSLILKLVNQSKKT